MENTENTVNPLIEKEKFLLEQVLGKKVKLNNGQIITNVHKNILSNNQKSLLGRTNVDGFGLLFQLSDIDVIINDFDISNIAEIENDLAEAINQILVKHNIRTDYSKDGAGQWINLNINFKYMYNDGANKLNNLELSFKH